MIPNLEDPSSLFQISALERGAAAGSRQTKLAQSRLPVREHALARWRLLGHGRGIVSAGCGVYQRRVCRARRGRACVVCAPHDTALLSWLCRRADGTTHLVLRVGYNTDRHRNRYGSFRPAGHFHPVGESPHVVEVLLYGSSLCHDGLPCACSCGETRGGL